MQKKLVVSPNLQPQKKPQTQSKISLISKKKRGSKKIIIILVITVVIILAIIGIVVGLYFALRKKSSTPPHPSPPPSTTPPPPPSTKFDGNSSSRFDLDVCSQIKPTSTVGTTLFKMLNDTENLTNKNTFSYQTNSQTYKNCLFYSSDQILSDFFAIGTYGFKGTPSSSNITNSQSNLTVRVVSEITILFCSNGQSVSDVLTGKGRLINGQSYPVKSFASKDEMYFYFGFGIGI